MSDPNAPPPGFVKLTIKSGFVTLIGPYYLRRKGDEYTYGMRTIAHHGNINGVLHGGVLFSFADTICGQYILSTLGRVCATVSMNSNFMASGSPGAWIEARPKLAKATRSLCYLGVDLTADGTPIYSANAVFKLFGEAKGIAAEAAI
jgi:uncharacterized protein (TIGR00369 family)